MSISIQNLISILGYPMMSEKAQSVLKASGFQPAYTPKKLKEYGSVHLVLEEHGIDLDFCDKKTAKEKYVGIQEDGDAIFIGIFLYPNGASDYKKISFPIGFGADDCLSREDALRTFGTPSQTWEDEGIVEWDRWTIDNFTIAADYSETQKISIWTISLKIK